MELSKLVSRQHYPLKGLKKRLGRPEKFEDIPLGLRRRARKMKPLNLDQKLEVVHRVIVGG